MGRTRSLQPLQEVGDPELLSHVRELKQARLEVASLRHELETLRRVLRTVCQVTRPYDPDRPNGPPRPHKGQSASGEPIY
jgi:hypothetical protein